MISNGFQKAKHIGFLYIEAAHTVLPNMFRGVDVDVGRLIHFHVNS